MQLFSFYKKKYDKRTKKMYIYCFEKLFFWKMNIIEWNLLNKT